MQNVLYVSVHDFKTHFSRYIRLLDNQTYDIVVIRRHKKDIAFLHSTKALQERQRRKQQLNHEK